MKNNFYFQKSLANIYAKPTTKSEITSQILYGEEFKILIKNKNWLKIKLSYDNYVGFLKYNKLSINRLNPSYKVFKLKSKIFKKVEGRFFVSKDHLYFGTNIVSINSNKKFVEFEKNKWIKKNDLKPINYYEKNFSKISKLFLNSKYLWGGKTANGIDCSALVQIYFFFNRIYFPRDTKDQIKFIKKIKDHKLYKKDKLLYWRGHVAISLNKNLLIHAYGPKKKVVIMKKRKTIQEIKKNINLNLKSI